MATMKKAFSMSKVMGSIRKKPAARDVNGEPASPVGDTPEAIAGHYVRQFCESGGNNGGDEVTFLPPIVDAAESSPAAAAECARLIRKFLHRDYWSRPSYQYNAIMLVRILSDNPGMTFTRNIDKKFVDTAKELLRTGRDPSVRQMLMETLDSFENTKGYDEGLGLIIEMWKKEKEKAYKAYGGRPAPGPRTLNAPPFNPHSQNYFARAHSNKRLPDPVELANRLEEARTSGKLLEQVVASTPPSEVLQNDLIKEFADRCLSASRSIQGYMTADNPAPDNETMESLIDTNEQLQQALNHHQRAVLNAKKHLGINERSNNPSPVQNTSSGDEQNGPDGVRSQAPSAGLNMNPPPLPGRKPVGNGKGKANADVWDAPGPSRSQSGTPRHDDDDRDPFRDPPPEPTGFPPQQAGGSSKAVEDEEPRLAYEPFHPGFSSASGSANKPQRGGSVTPVSDGNSEDAYNATPPQKPSSLHRY
ncbi:hypothetical protein GQ53DRAFT_56614 [Thozetella sp. PMI_491]|nr:hypothetical protein GQ53DRAFT_56614 [Thozetella sp. PMI_491]